MASKKVTIKDVANRAGVSTGTVSAVINDRATVGARTRKRVQSVIEEMDYHPSPSARNLGGQRGNGHILEGGVGLLIKEVDNPFYTEVVKGAQAALEARGYIAFTCASEGDYEKEGRLIKAFRDRSIDGVIIAPVLGEEVDLAHLFMLRRAEYPFVLLEDVPGLRAHVVSVDNVEAAKKATHFLIQLGHERIVHFAGPAYTQHTRERILGMEKAFSQSHLRFSESMVVRAGAHFEEGYEAARRFFQAHREEPPTAVTCFNDLVAMGVMRALAETDLHVPDDVSVMGFDDIPSSAFLSPSLTTVRVPKREMGRQAANQLLDLLEGEEPSPVHVVMDADLVERGSTRAIG